MYHPLSPIRNQINHALFRVINNKTYLPASLLWRKWNPWFPFDIFEIWEYLVNFLEILLLVKISNACALLGYKTHSATTLKTKKPYCVNFIRRIFLSKNFHAYFLALFLLFPLIVFTIISSPHFIISSLIIIVLDLNPPSKNYQIILSLRINSQKVLWAQVWQIGLISACKPSLRDYGKSCLWQFLFSLAFITPPPSQTYIITFLYFVFLFLIYFVFLFVHWFSSPCSILYTPACWLSQYTLFSCCLFLYELRVVLYHFENWQHKCFELKMPQ